MTVDEPPEITDDVGSRKAKRDDRSVLSHPLLIALVPVVGAIAIAVLTLKPGADSSPSQQPVPQAPAPPPAPEIAFRVDRDLDEYRDGWNVAFEGQLPGTAQLPVGGSHVDLIPWAAARGAVDVGVSYLRLYLENNGPERVTIRSINAKVTDRLSPISGTLVQSPSAGVNELVTLTFDLDKGDLVRGEVPSDPDSPQVSSDEFFSGNDISLDPGESTDLKLKVTSTDCHCHYTLELGMVKSALLMSLEIKDNAGRPFVITGPASRYTDKWSEGTLPCGIRGLYRAPDPVVRQGSVDCAAKA